MGFTTLLALWSGQTLVGQSTPQGEAYVSIFSLPSQQVEIQARVLRSKSGTIVFFKNLGTTGIYFNLDVHGHKATRDFLATLRLSLRPNKLVHIEVPSSVNPQNLVVKEVRKCQDVGPFLDAKGGK